MVTNRLQSVVVLVAAAQFGLWAVLPNPTDAKPNHPNYESAWMGFSRWFQRKKPPFAGRGGDCVISPIIDKEPVKIWNDRPIIIWNGKTNTIGMFSGSADKVIWKQKINENTKENLKLQYTGEALQPGQVYEWRLLTEDLQSTQTRPFQILKPIQRNQITADLRTLQAKLKSEGANAEAIAMRRAEFFTQRDLQSDALQELFSVQNPSPELQAFIQKVTTAICD